VAGAARTTLFQDVSDGPRVHRDLTVVIPTAGRPVIAECLRALAAGASVPSHVIVVDQSGRSDVAARVRALSGTGIEPLYLPSRQRGAAAARNRGIERVQTPLFATLDDDCCPAEDWADRLLEAIGAHPGAVVTGWVGSAGDRSLPSSIVDPAGVVHRTPPRNRDPLFTGNMGTARATFDRVGPFSEHPALLPAAEDNEWGYRALRMGVPIVYVPTVRVRHLDWQPDVELLATHRRYARGQGGFYGLYVRRGDLFITRRATRDIVHSLWLVLRGAITRNADLRVLGRLRLAELPRGLIAGLRRADV
jgi:GT2 family glycosyltransferase